MCRILRIAALLAAATASVCTVEVALAEESGDFRLLTSFERAYTTIEHLGGRVTGGSSSGTASVIESSGGPFVAGAHHLATCVILARESDGELEIEAPCTVTATTGDQLYVLSRRDSGDIAGGAGGLEILGGSGAWAGIRGSCSYDVEYIGQRRLVAISECEWRRP